MPTYYLNGTTLENSTAVFDDDELTTCSADGFYSDGNIVREQVSCLLLPIVQCPECLTPCGSSSIVGSSTVARLFTLNVDLGNAVSDVGAVIIKFAPGSTPVGIKATYNGILYNKVSSPLDGYHGSTVPNSYTYLGNTLDGCVPVAGNLYSNIPIYNHVDGTGFVDTGNVQSITPQAGELSLTTAAVPGTTVMVIPKLTADPQAILLEFANLTACPTNSFGVIVECPTLLTGYSSSLGAPDFPTACGYTIGSTFYNAPVSGIAGNPAVNDWVFQDAYGQYPLAQGFYKINATEYIEVDANGVVEDRANC